MNSPAPNETGRPALLPALLTAIAVFVALLLFAAYILSRKPKFAPELAFKDRAGAARALKAELGQGKPVLLHFWATWCAPCREELPALTQAVRDGGAGLTFVPVAVDEGGAAPVDKYLGEHRIAMEPLFDPGGGEAARIGTVSYPETWLIAPDGRVLSRWEGAGPWSPRYLAELARKAQ